MVKPARTEQQRVACTPDVLRLLIMRPDWDRAACATRDPLVSSQVENPRNTAELSTSSLTRPEANFPVHSLASPAATAAASPHNQERKRQDDREPMEHPLGGHAFTDTIMATEIILAPHPPVAHSRPLSEPTNDPCAASSMMRRTNIRRKPKLIVFWQHAALQ
jgi:hypothetical protein